MTDRLYTNVRIVPHCLKSLAIPVRYEIGKNSSEQENIVPKHLPSQNNCNQSLDLAHVWAEPRGEESLVTKGDKDKVGYEVWGPDPNATSYKQKWNQDRHNSKVVHAYVADGNAHSQN
jgi:hypothetical protein